MKLTKPAAVALQIVGGVLLVACLSTLTSGFSVGALLGIAAGVALLWQGGKKPRQQGDS